MLKGEDIVSLLKLTNQGPSLGELVLDVVSVGGATIGLCISDREHLRLGHG